MSGYVAFKIYIKLGTKSLMGNSARRRTLERSSHGSKNNIKTHLKDRKWVCRRHSCETRLVPFLVFAGVLKGKEFREWLRQHQLHTRRSALWVRFLRS
jgi:hypothetical protein